MIAIRHAALLSPMGDARATAEAIADQRACPGTLPGPLVEHLLTLVHQGPWAPEYILFASTKGDGPLWIEDCLGAALGTGGPAWCAQQLGNHASCPALAVSAACASGPAAIALAGMMLRDGLCERILVLAGDRLMPLVCEGFAGLQAIDASGAHPFSAERQGLSLGEVCAALWLERSDTGNGWLHGWGLRCDANHLTGPHREGRGVGEACSAAMAGRSVDLIVAHGTGTRYNDESEAIAYARIAPTTPVTAWKGGLGHSLGSCGVGEVALAHLAQQWGWLAGTQGYRSPGTSSPIPVLPPGRHPWPGGRILSANAGFGGLNAAVVIGNQAQSLPAAQSVRPRRNWRLQLLSSGWQREQADGSSTSQGWSFAHDATDGALPRLSARHITGSIDPSWGRMDSASRLAVALALLGADHYPESAALVLLSDRGCAESDRHCELAHRSGSKDPQRFAYTLPSTPLGEVSIRSQIRGPALTLPGASDEQGRDIVRLLLADGAPLVLLMRVEADHQPHTAWAEAWTAVD